MLGASNFGTRFFSCGHRWAPKDITPKHVFISISGELYCFNLFQMSDFQTCGTVVMHVHLFGNWPQHDMICSSSNATWQCLVSNLYCSQGCIILAMIVTYSNRQQNFSLISPKKDSAWVSHHEPQKNKVNIVAVSSISTQLPPRNDSVWVSHHEPPKKPR